MTGNDCKFSRKKKSEKRKIGRWALLALTGLILGLNLYRWNASALAGNALPMPFGIGAAVVLSGSMSPALKVDDLIIVREKDHYDVGDIVVYQSGSELIVHRIIAQEEGRIITKGDANNVSDVPVDVRMVKGAVAVRIPLLGMVVNILKLPAVGILLLVGACILMERSFQTEKRADEEDLDAMKAEIRRLKAELDSENSENTDRKAR